jgi:hypothetical protein
MVWQNSPSPRVTKKPHITKTLMWTQITVAETREKLQHHDRNHFKRHHPMARARLAFKTNEEAYFEAFETTDIEVAPPTGAPRFGLLVLGALGMAIVLAVGLAVLH